jgi:hypothetical protein
MARLHTRLFYFLKPYNKRVDHIGYINHNYYIKKAWSQTHQNARQKL